MTLTVMALLVVLKVLATTSCYGTGNAGGIFGPALFIGAMLGGTVGTVAHQVLPDFTGGVGAYALVGMGAAFAGIVRTPLTSVIMIFELTRDYTIIVPVMIANLISFAISYRLQRQPIYEALAHQEGVSLPTLRDIGEGRPTVNDIVRPIGDTDEPAALAAMLDAGVHLWPVVKNGQLVFLAGAGGAAPGLAELVYPDSSLSSALEKMGAGKVDALPVMSRAVSGKVLGVVTMPDVLAAFGVPEVHPV